MAATINGRELGNALLRDLMAALDAGATRQQLRAHVKRVQGRGISNETIAALRKTHVQLRRSQGYAITERSRTKLRATPRSPLPPVETLRRTITGEGPLYISPSRRPLPPRIEGVGQVEVVRFRKRDSGKSEVRQFRTGEGRAPLKEQVQRAAEDDAYETKELPALGRRQRMKRMAAWYVDPDGNPIHFGLPDVGGS